MFLESKIAGEGFPGGSVVQNPRASAGDRFNLQSGESPRGEEQLSLCAAAIEPVLWKPGATTTGACVPWSLAQQQEKPPQGEAQAPRPEGSLGSPQLEKKPTRPQIPSSARKKERTPSLKVFKNIAGERNVNTN